MENYPNYQKHLSFFDESFYMFHGHYLKLKYTFDIDLLFFFAKSIIFSRLVHGVGSAPVWLKGCLVVAGRGSHRRQGDAEEPLKG